MVKPLLAAMFTALAVLASGQPAQAGSLVTFKSTVLPYQIGVPSGWTHQAQKISGKTRDVFLSPDASSGFRDNVNVGGHKDASGLSNGDLLTAATSGVKAAFHVKAKKVGTVTIGGVKVTMIGYAYHAGGVSIVLTQTVVRLKGYDWFLTLANRRSDLGTARPLFVAMLQTFHTT